MMFIQVMASVLFLIIEKSESKSLYNMRSAHVKLIPSGEEFSNVSGTVTLIQVKDHVRLFGQIEGLTPGYHGFHVHQVGDTSDGCKAAGGHFNPDGNDHAAPTSDLRHAGDLGNILTPDDGSCTNFEIADSLITLGDDGPTDVAGRAIVVHLRADDLGLGTGDLAEGSKKHGNAGPRVACGVITLI